MPGEHMPGIEIPTGYGERSRQGINVVQIYTLPEGKEVACYEDGNRYAQPSMYVHICTSDAKAEACSINMHPHFQQPRQKRPMDYRPRHYQLCCFRT